MKIPRDQDGQTAVFVVVIMASLLLLAGLVIDGGYTLAAKRQAEGEADAAARAGVQAVDTGRYRSGAPLVLNRMAAQAAALNYLARTGHQGMVRVLNDTTIEVQVRIRQPMAILGAVGIGPLEVSGIGQARVAGNP